MKEIDPPTPASSECEAPKENPSRLENPSTLKQKLGLGPKERQFEAKRQKIDLIKRFSMPAASKDAKSKLQAEVATYQSEHVDLDDMDNDLFLYWKKRASTFPILSKIFRIIHCIPATSSEIERVWSQSGLILNSRRSKLSNDNVKNLIFLKYNWDNVKSSLNVTE